MYRSFKMAISSLVSSKMRSFLTMLGIIIGVASVIIIVSLVEGFKTSMTSTFESMGTNIITSSITHSQYYSKVTGEDVFEFVMENSNDILGASPTLNISGVLKLGELSTTTSGVGVSEDYFDIQGLSLANGNNISYLNCENYDKVVVIGSYNASELFGFDDPIGEFIKINGENFKVIGVLEQSSTNEEGSSDDTFIIPYNTAGVVSRNANISTYILATHDSEKVTEVKEKVDEFFIEKLGSDSYYSSFTLSDLLSEVETLTGMITLMLTGIASISLLVGGIGIMNIMLVSVTERTREIGIRKSLGGKRKDILSQFIIESGVTSSIGGLIGVAFGILMSYAIAIPMGMEVTISMPAVAISFGVSLFIGLFFGYFPAKKAAQLNPIDALRFD